MARKVILVITALRNSATTVMILVILPKTSLRKLLYKGDPVNIVDLTPTHTITAEFGTGHIPSITDTARGTALRGQDDVIESSFTEAEVTTGGMHSTLYPITTAILITPLQTGTLEDIFTGIPHTATSATHLDTYHARATCDTTPLNTVGLGPDTPQVLHIDHT